jgi:hypothetical protein
MSLRSLRRFNCADVAPRSASGHLLRKAQIIIESWRRRHNTIWPHASLGYKPPAPEVFMPAFAAWPAALRRPRWHNEGADCRFLECALDGGQFQAAVLTGCWAWRSSYCAGLR